MPDTKITAERLAVLKQMIEHNEQRMREQAEALDKMRALVRDIEKTIEEARARSQASSTMQAQPAPTTPPPRYH